jgi:hypothetical protein
MILVIEFLILDNMRWRKWNETSINCPWPWLEMDICNPHKQYKRTPKFKEPMLVRGNIDKGNFFINLLT